MIFEEDKRKEMKNRHSLEHPEEARCRKKLFKWLDSHYAGDYKIIIDRLKMENKDEI